MKKDKSKYRQIVKLRKRGLSFTAIGKEIGISRQRAQEIYKRASRASTTKLPSSSQL